MNDQRVKAQVSQIIQDNLAAISAPSNRPLLSVDPTLEPLQRSIEDRLPQFASRIAACRTSDELEEWRAVADLTTVLTTREPTLLSEFTRQIKTSRRPGNACLVLAELLGRRIVPPSRTAAWYRRDALGCIVSVLALAAAVIARVVALQYFWLWLASVPLDWSDNVYAWFGIRFILFDSNPSLWSLIGVALSCAWILVETTIMVPIAERWRRAPTSQSRLAQHNEPFRNDSLYVVYLLASLVAVTSLASRAWYVAVVTAEWRLLTVAVFCALLYGTAGLFAAAVQIADRSLPAPRRG